MKNHSEGGTYAQITCRSDNGNASLTATRRLLQRMTWGVLAFTALSCAPLLAQSTTADVVGTVTDTTGAVIPNATVQLTSVDTHETRTVTTGEGGEYTFTLLKPNRYSLSVTAAGFKSFQISSFALSAGDRAREDSHLTIGAQGETITVEATAPALHTDSAALITTVTEKQTQELPLNGRNYIALVQITPGATEGLNNSFGSGNRPDDRRQTSSVSVNGQADVINNQLIDGMDNNERVIGSIGVRPSVDAIQEVSVQTNVFTAEVGRTAGAAINVITKSGTNAFHGSVYEFFRNDILNANPFKFGAAIPKPKFRQNQFGGSLGGPIWKDHTFFFGDYEGLNIVRNLNPTTTTVPTLFERQNLGNFTDNNTVDATGKRIVTYQNVPTAAIDKVGLQYFNLFPLPTNSLFAGNYIAAPRFAQFNKTADGRLDHRFADGDLFYLRYTYNANNTDFGSLFPQVNTAAGLIYPSGNLASYPGPAVGRAHQAQFNYIHTFTPSILMELKAGYTLFDNSQFPLNFGTNINTAFGQPNINTDYRSAELSAVTVTQGANLGNRPPIIYHENTYQYEGLLTYIRGKQTFKVGGGVIRRQGKTTQTDTANGNWTFNDFSTLLQGDFVTGGRNSILLTPHNFSWEPHGFVQDDVHLTSKLTVNIGARYDLFTPYTEKNNILSNFDITQGIVVVAGVNGVSNTGNVKTDYTNFAPRVGFAYTVFPKTVLRGGFGMTFAPENLTSGSALVNQPFTATFGPFTPTQAANAAGAQYAKFAGGLPTPIVNSATSPSGAIVAALDTKFRSTYIEQFNLTAEREFAGFVGSVSYVGELGRHVGYYLSDYNTVTQSICTFTPTATGCPANYNFNNFRRFRATVPNVTNIPLFTSNASSNYHAMQAVLKRRYAKGLDTQIAYTWARLLDNAETISNNGGNGFGSLAENIPTLEYGNGNLDVRHRVTGTFNYSVPFGQNTHGLLGILAKGWQTNGVVIWNTGMPFSVTNANNRSGTRPSTTNSDRPNQVGSGRVGHPTIAAWFNTADFVAQPLATFGNQRRNQLHGPGLQRVDLSVFKNFDIYEHLKLEFRTEAFNVLNTAQFINPIASLGNPLNGRITSTANAYNPRLIQFAARLKF